MNRQGYSVTRNDIVKLMKSFYKRGWLQNTCCGIATFKGKMSVITPVRGMRAPEDAQFFYNLEGGPPSSDGSNGYPVVHPWNDIYNQFKAKYGTISVCHTHSVQDVLIAELFNDECIVKLKDYDLIKGIFNNDQRKFMCSDDTVIVPIINGGSDETLLDNIGEVLDAQPSGSAILVRNHGSIFFAPDLDKLEKQVEVYEHLFQILIEKKKLGIN